MARVRVVFENADQQYSNQPATRQRPGGGYGGY
jgi:hypothetical protein